MPAATVVTNTKLKAKDIPPSVRIEDDSGDQNMSGRSKVRIKKSESKTSNKSRSKTSLTLYDPKTPGLDVLHRCKFLFLRRTDVISMGFLMEALSSYEVYLPSGDRLYYVKEMKGSGERDRSSGSPQHLIFCILSGTGRELLRMEGSRASPSEISTLAVYQGPAYIGEIRQRKPPCSYPMYHVMDDNNKAVATIRRSARENEKCCCAAAMEYKAHYDVILPTTQSIIGTMGKIARFYPQVSRDLDDCYGVEVSDALNIREKSLLLCAIFLVFPKLSSHRRSLLDRVVNAAQSIRSVVRSSRSTKAKSIKSVQLKTS